MASGDVYVDGKGFDLAVVKEYQRYYYGIYEGLVFAFRSNKPAVIYNIKEDGVIITPTRITVRAAENTIHSYLYFELDMYYVRIYWNGSVYVQSRLPEPTPTITATTDELFVQTYLDGLADGSTVVVTPKARTQGQMYTLNLGTKVIYLDFSGYTGTVSITCTGFTSQGNKVYKVTGAISPWIQSESATAITINED